MSTVYRITELYNVLRPLRRTNNLITSTIRCICPLPQKIIRYSQHKFNSYKQKLYNSNINSTNLSIPARYNYEKYNKSTVSLPVFNKLFYPSIILTSFVFALYNNMNNGIIGLSIISIAGLAYYVSKDTDYFTKKFKNNNKQQKNNDNNTTNNLELKDKQILLTQEQELEQKIETKIDSTQEQNHDHDLEQDNNLEQELRLEVAINDEFINKDEYINKKLDLMPTIIDNTNLSQQISEQVINLNKNIDKDFTSISDSELSDSSDKTDKSDSLDFEVIN